MKEKTNQYEIDLKDVTVVIERQHIAYSFYKSKCNVVEPFDKLDGCLIARFIRRKISSISLFRYFFINKKLRNINSKIIMMLDSIPANVAEYIRKHNESNLLVYYINPISLSQSIQIFRNLNCDIVTFDSNDSITYGIPLVPLHYIGTNKENPFQNEYDVIFVGADKGRYKYIKSIEKILSSFGFRCKFLIMYKNNSPFFDKSKYSKRIPYNTNIELILKSKVVLELTQKNQTGLTIRTSESMVNHKKLITDNKQIKKYPFYNPNNIFVLGSDDLNNLPEFVSSPWDHKSDDIVKDFLFEKWINNVIKVINGGNDE